jgi:phenylpropionate dioxygenase-like ring-hydroxylating dioxygenase large terminal subunit
MFLAHKQSIADGHYIPLPQFNNEKILANLNGEYKLISNICPHQGSLISIKPGNGNRVCPYHNWSFNLAGDPVTSGRTEHYCKNTTPLVTKPVYEWNHLLFTKPVDFKLNIDLENLELVEQRIDLVKANAETIMDLFLDVDHIPAIHNGVYDQIGITDTSVEWEYYNIGSIQTVKQGAKWISIYPDTMIEWQQGTMFITVAVPKDYNNSLVHVFKYQNSNMSKEEWTLNEKVWETAWLQDMAQSKLIVGVNTHNLEQPKQHFKDWKKNGSIVQ